MLKEALSLRKQLFLYLLKVIVLHVAYLDDNHNYRHNKYRLTRRGYELRITDLAQTLRYVFGCRNVKKAATLDPNAQKAEVLRLFSFILKKHLKKSLFLKR